MSVTIRENIVRRVRLAHLVNGFYLLVRVISALLPVGGVNVGEPFESSANAK
jgi:hypothetical protein